jgi:hypothetical protein
MVCREAEAHLVRKFYGVLSEFFTKKFTLGINNYMKTDANANLTSMFEIKRSSYIVILFLRWTRIARKCASCHSRSSFELSCLSTWYVLYKRFTNIFKLQDREDQVDNINLDCLITI